MVTYIVGVPGSGKTAYAVYQIMILSKKTAPDGSSLYSTIYNNIGGFKHHLIENSRKYIDDNFVAFMKELHQLYDLHKKNDNLDDVLIDFTKANGYYKSLIIVDEVHNTFSSSAKSDWIWLLSYHRHIFVDFIFITQSMAMIESPKLKNMAEVFIKALQPSLRIFGSTFRYEFYENARLAKSAKYKTDSIKMTDDVFRLYKSGDSVKQKSIIVKFIVIALVLLFLVIVIGYYAYKRMFSDEEKKVIDTNNNIVKNIDNNITSLPSSASGLISSKNIKKTIVKPKKIFNLDDTNFNKKVISITCIDHYCNFYNYYNVPQLIVKKFIDEDLISLINYKKTSYRDKYLVLVDDRIYPIISNYELLPVNNIDENNYDKKGKNEDLKDNKLF